MTFSEDYPSMKGKGKVVVDENSTNIDDLRTQVFDMDEVIESCLDKAIVKKIVEKHIKTCISESSCVFTQPIEIITCQEVIFYELGFRYE